MGVAPSKGWVAIRQAASQVEHDLVTGEAVSAGSLAREPDTRLGHRAIYLPRDRAPKTTVATTAGAATSTIGLFIAAMSGLSARSTASATRPSTIANTTLRLRAAVVMPRGYGREQA